VTVTLALDAEERSGLKASSILGTLPGTTDEDIWVIAHMDAYFDGAIDNGSGLAVMMGLLQHFAKVPAAERKRNIIFMGSVGHHGGPGTRWMHDERATALAKTALIINMCRRYGRNIGDRICARAIPSHPCAGGCGAAGRCSTSRSNRSRNSTSA
jgi:hypothetical protein